MAISAINNYRDTLYQWQGQQLKSTGSTSSTAKSQASSLFGSNSMIQQVQSMIELTKYAMDAMGVGADSRVTFTQISKYREQLQSEFNQSVKQGFEEFGIGDLAALSFSLDKDGKISVSGANAQDRKSSQAWFDANPAIGTDLLKKLQAAGIQNIDAINFMVSSTGKISLVDKTSQNIQANLDKDNKLSDDMRAAFEKMGIDLSKALEFEFSDNGALKLRGNHEQAEQINAWLAENPAMADAIKSQLEKNNIDTSAVSLRLGKTGTAQININNALNNEIQAVFDQSGDIGKKITSALGSMGIDSNINFTIKVNDDGTFSVISDHPDRDKVQAFFEQHPELIKKYRQIETLAGIDDARKAMQISPSEMRKRIQIESMACWWADSGNSNSYFGQYGNGNLSLMSGLNMKI